MASNQQQLEQQHQQRQQQHQQQHIVSHLNNDIYNNGLKFERDRTFRNKLIMKAIIIMAFLLILAALLCATMTKPSVPPNYDPDSENPETEVLQELKTAFVPSPIGYHNINRTRRSIPDKKSRSRRQDTSFNNFEDPGIDNASDKDILLKNTDLRMNSQDFDVIWLTGSDVVGRKDENKTEDVKNDYEKNDNEAAQVNPNEKEKNKYIDRYGDISMFWKEEMDEYSIRNTQAKKMLSYMDFKADPCNDFYQYACGNWEKRNPIPEDKAGFDTFEMLKESLDYILRDLLLEPVDNNTAESIRKAKDLFESCMNEGKKKEYQCTVYGWRENGTYSVVLVDFALTQHNKEILQKRGNEPLYELSKSLKGWPMISQDWNASDFDWLELMAELRLYNNGILLAQWVGPDIKNSAQHIVQFDQTSLGLPTRDYYLQESNSAYLEAYKSYMIQITILLGANKENATADAEELIEFETRLAGITAGLESRRNVSKLYVKMSLFDLTAVIPQIDWIRYLTIVLARKVEPDECVVIFALKYFKDLVKLIDTTPPRTIANYMMWRFMKHRVNSLGKEFQDAKQDFLFVLFGSEKAPPRWTICVSQVNTNMGMALGSMFVKRYFDETSRNDTISMTQDIMHSFRDILNATEWITPETKTLAQDKVDAMVLRIGYPDFLLNEKELDEYYKQVNISKDLYFENTLNLLRYSARMELDSLNKRVNKTQWNTPPAVVNAYYSRNKNQIMFPAGILQPPFYHKYFPRSLNYGGIGIVIGHEITHGFDDKGRLFDQDGNLDRWWDEGAIEKFYEKAKCLIDQYSAYTVRDINVQIDGVHTQGENIADNGGIKQAFKAYERWLQRNNGTDETLPGLNATNYQLFFLNFAQVWCGGMRPEASRNKLKTAVHSPGKFRVIGTLSNFEEFAKAFNCSTNTTMNPDKKCQVW